MDALLAGRVRPDPIPLGHLLLRKKFLDADQLARAIAEQNRTGVRLGDILISRGIIAPLNLYIALAEQKRTPLVDLMSEPPDPALVEPGLLQLYLAYRLVPWRKHDGILYIAAADPEDHVINEIAKRFGENCRVVLATPRDIRQSVERLFAQKIEEEARFGLWRRMPEKSARRHWKLGKYLFFAILLEVLTATCFFPHICVPLLVGFFSLFFAGTLLFKLYLFSIGDVIHQEERVEPKDNEKFYDSDLPVYSILVPLYDEARSVPGLLKSLRTLDYPKHKLDIKLVVEADDTATIDAIKKAKPESYFEMIHVPPSQPRTKPKACNYALRFARGTYLTIYDAEDRPEPDQLRKAVKMFRHVPPKVICLQARLNYYNRKENLLTRLFSIEYATLFNFLLPALYHLHIPILLGGTSNHMALAELRRMGAWDPYNVTEDADLGIRLAALGYRTMPLDSVTMEESPLHLNAWLKQRSRWIKGYIQTWLVYMRHPVALHRVFGTTGFWGLQFFLGGSSIVYIAAPFLWLLSFCWMVGGVPKSVLLSEPLVQLSYTVLVIGVLLQWWMAWRTAKAQHWQQMSIAVFLFPCYWILHSVASARALWQLFFKPYHWDKTEHGLSKMLRFSSVSA